MEEPPEIQPFVNTIIVGDAEEVLRALPAESVDMVITSPPYNFGHSYAGDQTEEAAQKPLFEYGEAGEVVLPAPYPDPRLMVWGNP